MVGSASATPDNAKSIRQPATSLTQAESLRAQEIARRSLRAERTAPERAPGTKKRPRIGHTFSHKTTMRLYKSAATGGIAGAATLCATVAPAGPVGKALSGAGCAALAHFLIGYGTPDPNECVRAYLDPVEALGFRMVRC